MPNHKDCTIIQIKNDEDVIIARQQVRDMAQKLGFSILDQTRIVTATSELARNMVVYAGGGKVTLETLSPRPGIGITFSDQGPGIADADQAMQEGFSTNKSLGLGISGAKKLMDEFSMKTWVGQGTTVLVKKWLTS